MIGRIRRTMSRTLRPVVLAAAALLALTAVGSAQTPAPAPGTAPAAAGRVGSSTRIAVPAGPRRPRGFRECNREAQGRRLRGMERRRFVYRCQVGSGRPLFRRRGPPTPPPAPAPVEGTAPATR